MVGEIRDQETANMAVQASLTGHLVLSTLHTNTAVGAITRLRDMGIEPFLLSSTLIGVLAQRLMRKLCPHCKKPKTATKEEQKTLQISTPVTIYESHGCDQCQHSGYLGRTGVYEIINITQTMKSHIHDESDEHTLLSLLGAQHKTLHTQAIQRVIDGISSINELLRISSGERE